jgi:DNA-binding GntR family transcriptional regulator
MEARSGRRVAIVLSRPPEAPMPQMQDIHEKLREMILSLDIGPGERLSERWLEAKFEGSRTPVRAALIRLEGEGLVRREGRNWAVSPIDLDEIEFLYEFREPLEAAAIRLACQRAEAGDIDGLEALLASCRPGASREEWHRVGTEFHVGLARLSRNPFVVKAIEDIMTRLARPRWLEVWTEPPRDHAWADHRQILDSIRRNLPDEAVRQAIAHIRNTRDRLVRSLREDRRGLKARGFAVISR